MPVLSRKLGIALTDLGQLEAAATAYEEAIQRDEKLDDARSVAVGKGQLGTVRTLQQRYAEALDIYIEVREIFEGLGELGTVATVWHQIGIVHRQTKQFEAAEQAYRQALAIEVQRKNQAGEARSLSELGNLYKEMGRLEEAVAFYQQAADIDVELKDLAKEGIRRNNLANTFIKLERYDEARRELHRAIACKKPYGHVATPWTTWHNLYDLEQATHHPEAAAKAREKAIQCFLDYRRIIVMWQNCVLWLLRRLLKGILMRPNKNWLNIFIQVGSYLFLNCKPFSTERETLHWLMNRTCIMTMLWSCGCCWRNCSWIVV